MSLITYFRETKAEMKHVNWPTRKQTLVYTGIVVALSLVAAIYLGFFDYVFNLLLEKFLI